MASLSEVEDTTQPSSPTSHLKNLNKPAFTFNTEERKASQFMIANAAVKFKNSLDYIPYPESNKQVSPESRLSQNSRLSVFSPHEEKNEGVIATDRRVSITTVKRNKKNKMRKKLTIKKNINSSRKVSPKPTKS